MMREAIKKMKPYKPPLEGRASGDYLLLDFNEMTIDCSPKVKEALSNLDNIQVYPEYGELDKRIAEYAGVSSDEVMVVNGSDQGIDIIMRAFLNEGDKVIIPSPSFAMFYQSAQIQGAEILKPEYTDKFPLKEVLELASSAKLIVICNPNNPTGTLLPKEDLIKILETGVPVLHDEAYFEFSGLTAKDLISKYDNLFVCRTFSKQFGLAALRAGYVISQKKNIDELMKIRGPYDINMAAKAAILAALDDVDYMKKYVSEVMEKSKPDLENFFKENNIKFWPSSSNFILIKPEDADKLYSELKNQGILVRKRHKGTVRISVGTKEDINKLKKAFKYV